MGVLLLLSLTSVPVQATSDYAVQTGKKGKKEVYVEVPGYVE